MKAELIHHSDILSVLPKLPIISIAGAGGKTTLMFLLSRIIPGPVVVTTTTKVGENQIIEADQQLSIADFPPEKMLKTNWVSPSLKPNKGKIHGCSQAEFSQLSDFCSKNHWALIAETDGAACRHIKAPDSHEPPIPKECNVCFYLTGLDTIGKTISNEFVHRPEIFAQITGLLIGAQITEQSLAILLDHPMGGLKNTPAKAIRIAYFTHGNTPERVENGKQIAKILTHYDYYCIN